MGNIFTDLVTSVGLGFGAGVNAYATFLVFGLVSRLMPGTFNSDLAHFFAMTPVLIVLGVLYSIEFVADKIPAVDHVWDVIHTFIRPVAGSLVAIAATRADIPKGVVIIAAVLAGATALGSHAAKATIRAGSTLTTAGTANPIISVLEDVFVVFQSILAIFAPLILIAFLIFVVAPLTIYFIVRYRRRMRREAA